MDVLWFINQIRYKKPLENIIEHTWITAPLSVLTMLSNTFYGLVASDVELWIVLCFLLIVDFLFGMLSSYRNKTPITSLGMRQSVIKTIEYVAFLLILVMLSNAIGKYDTEEMVKPIQYIAGIVKYCSLFGFILIFWTEVVSISENMIDKQGVIKKMIDIFKDKLKNL